MITLIRKSYIVFLKENKFMSYRNDSRQIVRRQGNRAYQKRFSKRSFGKSRLKLANFVLRLRTAKW